MSRVRWLLIGIVIGIMLSSLMVGCTKVDEIKQRTGELEPITEGESDDEVATAREELMNGTVDGYVIVDGVLVAYSGSKTEIQIPEGVIAIGDDVFHNDATIQRVTTPSTLKSIGYASFREMEALEEIILNEGLEVIGEASFELCESLSKLTLPSTIQTIDFMAFQDCISLEEIVIPSSVKSLGEQSFYRCERLGRVVFDGDAVLIEETAFEGCDVVVFVCGEGSTAEAYAKAHDIKITK